MNDLIYRQTAINMLCSKCTVDKPETCSTIQKGDNWCEEVYTLQRVPSAQPEIIRCKDCDWWTKQKDSLQGRCELMQMYPTGAWYCGNAKRRTDG